MFCRYWSFIASQRSYIFHSWVLGDILFFLIDWSNFSTLFLRLNILYYNFSNPLIRLFSEFALVNFHFKFYFILAFPPRDDISLFNYIFIYFTQLFIFSLSSFYHLFMLFLIGGLRLLIFRVIIVYCLLLMVIFCQASPLTVCFCFFLWQNEHN